MEFKSFKNKRDSRKEYRINRIIMEFKLTNHLWQCLHDSELIES